MSIGIKLYRRSWDVILFETFLIMMILMSARQLMKNLNKYMKKKVAQENLIDFWSSVLLFCIKSREYFVLNMPI